LCLASLTELSPANRRERDYFVAVKAYFDGGNEADSSRYEFLTLASLAGESIHCDNFRTQWEHVCERHEAKYLHTTDAVSLQNDFSVDKGWTAKKVDEFIADCAGALERCCATLDLQRNISYPGLHPTTITVNLRDFIKALRIVPDLGTPEHLCATQCAQAVFTYGIHIIRSDRFHFIFDQNERFLGHIQDRVHNKRSRQVGPLWKQIKHLGESDSREVAALQGADLFAWSVNNFQKHSRVTRVWQQKVLGIARTKEIFRYKRLINPIREHIEIVKSFKLPPRKPPR